jgi:sugar phosphate isomerase/epimerase
LDLASVYQPVCLVAHAGFRAPLYTEHTNEWIRASVQTWKDCLHHAPASGRIVLENVHETDPDILAAVFKRFPENTLGWCLDMGHWHCFARGRDRENLEHWMTILGPRLTHIHLHDNHGLKDEHLGMGQGSISWEDFFSLANTTRGRVTVTLEPHEPNALVQSLAFLSLQKIPSGPLHDLPSAAYDLLQRAQSRIHDLKL